MYTFGQGRCGGVFADGATGLEDNITMILAKLSGSFLTEATEDTVRIHPLNFNDIHDTADQDTAEIL